MIKRSTALILVCLMALFLYTHYFSSNDIHSSSYTVDDVTEKDTTSISDDNSVTLTENRSMYGYDSSNYGVEHDEGYGITSKTITLHTLYNGSGDTAIVSKQFYTSNYSDYSELLNDAFTYGMSGSGVFHLEILYDADMSIAGVECRVD